MALCNNQQGEHKKMQIQVNILSYEKIIQGYTSVIILPFM